MRIARLAFVAFCFCFLPARNSSPFSALGSKIGSDPAPAVAVAFGALYSLDLMLMLVLSFKLRSKPDVFDRSNDYLYT